MEILEHHRSMSRHPFTVHVIGFIVMILFSFIGINDAAVNDRPIIAVLSLPVPASIKQHAPNATSYFPASYVKFIESAGGRVAPLVFDWPDERFYRVLNSVSAVLFTGGGAELAPQDLYFRRTEQVVAYTWDAHNLGDHFPLWGTCLGFEAILVSTSGNNSLLESCDATNLTLPIDFLPDARNSHLFNASIGQSGYVFDALASNPITFNEHRFMVTPEAFEEQPLLRSRMRILATNVDRQGQKFVSIAEGITAPIFTVQFHPEKSLFEWDPWLDIPHSDIARAAAQYFANFFVTQAKKTSLNVHSFSSDEEEESALVYRFDPVYTGHYGSFFEQCYVFDGNFAERAII